MAFQNTPSQYTLRKILGEPIDFAVAVVCFTGSSLVPMVVFIVGNIFFIILDLTGKPAALLKYRIQEEKTVPVSCTKLYMQYCMLHTHCTIPYICMYFYENTKKPLAQLTQIFFKLF